VIGAGLLAVLVSSIPEMWTEWCARCHAADGSGKVEVPTITVEPMDFTDCKVATPEPDADWQLAIAHGGPAVGLSSQMPAFGDTLSAEQVDAFVDHIRTFCRERGWPHGNMNFPRPIFSEKAFPENEFIIAPIVSGTSDVEVAAIFERRLGRRAMWEVALPMANHGPHGTISRVELAMKYVLNTDAARTQITSVGMEVMLGRGTAVFEPYVAAGTIWREVYLQGQAKIELPADRTKADRAFVYNLYAGRDTSAMPTTWTFGVELNGDNDKLALTPQARKGLTKTGALAAAVGLRLPLNQRREQGTRLAGYVLWEYLDPVRARP
jgi:hypothetical protein